jgi:hypothetical protein
LVLHVNELAHQLSIIGSRISAGYNIILNRRDNGSVADKFVIDEAIVGKVHDVSPEKSDSESITL